MSNGVCTSIRDRKNVENMTEEELTRFRDAMRQIQALPGSDDRSFSFIAGLHGFPGGFCPHHRPTFLTWHRAYINALEMALRQFEADVTHPYWDWSAEGVAQPAIPKAYTAATYVSGDGVRRPNPLRRFTFTNTGGNPQTTGRSTGTTARLLQLGAAARGSLDIDQFNPFQSGSNRSLENAHDGVHGWVGGTMGSIDTAAFDPVFWAHHANIDRLWAAWQARHGNASMPQSELDARLAPWPVQGKDVVDSKNQLCYRYTAGIALRQQPRVTAAGLKLRKKKGPRPLKLRFNDMNSSFDSIELQFQGLQYPADSYEIRVFINTTTAGFETETESNPNYAGSINLFGHGECWGAPGHCDYVEREPGDIRGPHHLKPFDRSLDVTDVIKNTSKGQDFVRVSLVVFDSNEAPADHTYIEWDKLFMIARD